MSPLSESALDGVCEDLALRHGSAKVTPGELGFVVEAGDEVVALLDDGQVVRAAMDPRRVYCNGKTPWVVAHLTGLTRSLAEHRRFCVLEDAQSYIRTLV